MTSRNRPIVRAPRRNRQWAMTTQNGTVAAATHAGQLVFNLLGQLESDLGSELHNVTISALNYDIAVRTTGSTAGDTDVLMAAIMLVGEDAFAAGGVALPDLTADHADYMWWQGLAVQATRAASADQEITSDGFVIRNRSMRKMRENHQTLALIVAAQTLVSDSLQIFVAGRALVLLP